MSDAITNNPDLWRGLFPWAQAQQHKYDRGHVVVSGGGIAHTGAARLAARGALRIGAGLVSIACDREALPVYAASNMAVMCKLANDVKEFAKLVQDARVTAVVIGPGNGVSEDTKQKALIVLAAGKNTVLDADALSVFEGDTETLCSAIRSPCVLTPHEGEFARVFGASDKDRVTRAREAAAKTNAVVLLKGAQTVIASPDGKAVINENAPPTLATAGSGDVLAGMIGGLMAAGMPAFETACCAAWMHGEAATLFGDGLIAEDIPELLPRVMAQLRYT